MLAPLVLAAALISVPIQVPTGDEIHSVQVIGITDGDTLTVLENRQQIKIRLANIDAPERRQPYGQRSRQSLADLCYGKQATYLPEAIDKYGRTVAVVICDGVDASRMQVARGMAWTYTRNSKDPSLQELEQSARAARLGLWHASNPIPPWKWRRLEQKQ